MAELRYVIGDATRPRGDGIHVIVHVVNDLGRWGAGFSGAVSRRWPEVERLYRQWYRQRNDPASDWRPFELGEVLSTEAGDGLVMNLVGQHGIRSKLNPTPVRYDAIRTGLRRIADWFGGPPYSFHMPRIGCGLAGGRWEEVEPIVREEFVAHGVDVTVYDLPT